MVSVKGTTVIHGNHGFFMLDGQIIGRARNVTLTVEGSLDEFYEVGSAWLQDHEVINRKVNVSIERGAIDFKLLAYATGIQAEFITDDIATTNVNEQGGTFLLGTSGSGGYNLIVDEGESNVLTMSPDGTTGTQVLSTSFLLDVIVAANKIINATTIVTYFVTAIDCKIIRHGLTAPQSAYWTTNMDLTGKQVSLGGIAHVIK